METDPQKLIVLVWDFQWKENLLSGPVKPVREYEGNDRYLSMPWLNISNCNCNCSQFPVCGDILQNTRSNSTSNAPELTNALAPDDGDSEESDGAKTPDEEPDNESPTCHEIQYTETFKLKGTSFHAHFEEALRQYKQCQLNDNEPTLKLVFEPVNKRDENAIVVVAKLDNSNWVPIGYIPIVANFTKL